MQKSLTNALGLAGSHSAVVALANLANNRAPQRHPAGRWNAITAFVQMRHPTLEAMRILPTLVSDPNPAVRSAARLMSGALARAGRPEHPDEANAIDSSLISLYRNAGETGEAIEILGALGNSAGPSVVPVIEEALRSSHVSVRSAAARSLRLIPGRRLTTCLPAS